MKMRDLLKPNRKIILMISFIQDFAKLVVTRMISLCFIHTQLFLAL